MKSFDNWLQDRNKKQWKQLSRVMSGLLVVSSLSLLSGQAQALNLIPNPGQVDTTFTVNAGETLDSGDLFIYDTGTFENHGVSSEAKFFISGQLNNYGYLAWVGEPWDQVNPGATVVNYPSGTMVFGSGSVFSNILLDWHGGDLNNQGLIRILGGQFIFEGGAISNAASGRMIIESSTASSFTDVPLYNFGYFEVAQGGTWCELNGGAYGPSSFYSTGETVIDGQMGVKNLQIMGVGALRGKGTLNIAGSLARVVGAAKLAPGSRIGEGIGTLTINSTPALQLGSELETEIRGAGTANYDILKVNGQVSINGRLNVILRRGYTPVAGSVFNIVQATSSTGQFANVSLPTLPAGRSWSVQYTPTGVSLLVQ